MIKKISLKHSFRLFSELHSPKSLVTVNDSQVLVVKVLGNEIPWHTHENEDELFFVVKGRIKVHTKHRTLDLNIGDMLKMPKGVEHKVSASKVAYLLLIESNSFQHTGSTKSSITNKIFEPLY